MQESKIVDRTPEKVQLAKELGLHSWAAIHGMVNMKFKRISSEAIEHKLGIGRRMWKRSLCRLEFEPIAEGVLVSVVAGVVAGGVATANGLALHTQLMWAISVGFGLGLPTFLGAWYTTGLCRVWVKHMELSRWTDNMPYGALLAVKEATEAGLTNFHIYYPTAVSERIMSDPVIVGFMENGQMYEVFYWDDGKIYE